MATTVSFNDGVYQWTLSPGEVGDWLRIGGMMHRSIQVTFLAGAGGSIDVEVTNKVGDANVPAQKLIEAITGNSVWANEESWEFVRPNGSALTGANCIVLLKAK